MAFKVFLLFIFLIYFYVSINSQRKIKSTILLTKKQKLINSILVWLIPFIWFFLIKHLIKSDDSIMTRGKRKVLNKKNAEFSGSGSSGVGLEG